LRYRSLPEFDSQVLTITKNAAEICHFDIHYRSDLNWQTYEACFVFPNFLRMS
jgi:hypothetical protein